MNCILRIKQLVIIVLCFFGAADAYSQVLTHEDSLSAGLNIKGNQATAISGYGEAYYKHDFRMETAEARLRRVVLFVGHRFNSKISFFSEMELEDAKVGTEAGEISMEQAFLKFDVSRSLYIQAGFFTPRIGIINENHLPNTFNGNERPLLEQVMIPATWRELGLGVYGTVPSLPGLNYSVALLNGLNAGGFDDEFGITNGRQEGYKVSARQKAVTAALLYYLGPFRFQVSGYAGGSAGYDNKTADRLGLSTGFFGTPVYLTEANIQYRSNGLTVKALGCQIMIPDAAKINTAFANNTPEKMQGFYGEVAYDILHRKHKGAKQFNIFSRYENIDMAAKMPENGIENPYYRQQHIFAGINWLPVRGVCIKLDYQYASNGTFNQSLIINPAPYTLPYYTDRQYLNLGVAYSF